jgi:hypothetical protein
MEYYHFENRHRGNRYFKADRENKIVYQVCLKSGEKDGQKNCEGLYKIQWSSFMGTYYWHLGRKSMHTRMVYTTELQYKKALTETIKKFIINTHE